jgi:hypothetical protein
MRTGSKVAVVASVLATALVTAAAGTAIAASHPAGHQVELRAGQTGTAAQVPWRQVGSGWELVEYDATTNTVGHIKPGPVTLYLVDPAGGRYRMYRWAARAAVQPYLADWSGDVTRALFVAGTNTVQQLNLRTGKMSAIRLQHAPYVIGASYTRPSGGSLLVADGSSQRVTIYTLRGAVQRPLGSNSEGAIQSADGSRFILPGAAGLRVTTSSGRLIRDLPVRGANCSPVRYWDARTILAMCMISRNSAGSRLWLVPVSGRAPSALTSARVSPPVIANLNAWRLSSGLYLQSAGACGSLFISRQHSNGRTSVVNVPGTNGQLNMIITATGSRLLVQAGTGCEPSSSLLWFNPAGHAEQWLIRTPGNVDGVIAVVPFYSRAYRPGI